MAKSSTLKRATNRNIHIEDTDDHGFNSLAVVLRNVATSATLTDGLLDGKPFRDNGFIHILSEMGVLHANRLATWCFCYNLVRPCQ